MSNNWIKMHFILRFLEQTVHLVLTVEPWIFLQTTVNGYLQKKNISSKWKNVYSKIVYAQLDQLKSANLNGSPNFAYLAIKWWNFPIFWTRCKRPVLK